jgi:Spy/CpxP family protein refolding chaperone
MSKTRGLRIVLYAALIFLAGGITGAFVAPKVGRHFMRPPRAEELSRHMLEHLQSELSLTADQATKIRPLIQNTGREMEQLRRETTQRVRARIAETNAEISRLLTPEQEVKFQRLEAEHRRHLHHGEGPDEAPPVPR